ncbi:hypothetical protein [Streptomyces sp. NPDC019937]|uniref:putative phage holin n=1 Tax=Streptomyces sp. NPDC019937 TaxID=3154787 RepID=UPI00340B5AE5
MDQWVNVVASCLVFLTCAAFAVVYHWLAPWWRSDVGRNLMAFAASVGLLCLYTMLIAVWPDGCAAVLLRSCRVAVLVAIAVLMAQRTRMVVRAQRGPVGRKRADK